MPYIKENNSGVTLKIYIQPRSSKNMIAGLHADALKIKLTAPPVDGAANKMCIKYLAKWLKVPKSSIEILSGHTSRTKRLHLKFRHEKSADGTESERIRRLIASLSDCKKTV
jgi:hypothetical protein